MTDIDRELLLHKAIRFAAKKHNGVMRKGGDVPYISHPAEVMALLIQCGCREECAAAGALHDTLEDTDTTYDELVSVFGEEIAALVGAETEDKTKTWQERKQATIDGLAGASEEVRCICLADKLSNIRSMLYDYSTVGDVLWRRFNADREHIAWYYRSIINATHGSAPFLRDRLIECYKTLFGSDGLII